MSNQENPVANQIPQNGHTAQKIPPRLKDRLDLNEPGRTPDNLPALKNQLQMAMEMMQKAIEQNMAAERRRMRRMLIGFTLAMTALAAGLLLGMGWFAYQLQERLTAIAIAAAPPVVMAEQPTPTTQTTHVPPATATPPVTSPSPQPTTSTHAPVAIPETVPAAQIPTAQVPTAQVPTAHTQTSTAPMAQQMTEDDEDTRILKALEQDLLLMEEKSRLLDELLASQNSRLQVIMDEVEDLNTELQTPADTPSDTRFLFNENINSAD